MQHAANRGPVLLMLVSLFVVTSAQCAADAVSLPAEVSFVPGVMALRDDVQFEPWNEMRFPDDKAAKLQSGKHWNIRGTIAAAADKYAAWDVVKAAALRNGWTLVLETRTQPVYGTMHFAQKGVEAWLNASIFDPRHVDLDLMEPAPLPYTLTLAPPQPTPERITPDNGDFPYLTPVPGSKLKVSGLDRSPFWVTPEGASKEEIVASESIDKSYRAPEGFTNALFIAEYRPALIKAGWTIAETSSSADADILAHYAQQGRNLWTYLHRNGGGYDIRVADIGAKDLGKTLSTTCHVALYGLLFDFNKATLQAASDPVLQQVLALLKKDAALKVEVQGHTDNVGTDAYNQTLSDARASTVVAWLTQHGIAAARLTSKGYGKMKPVADNGNEEGRAKNRRVEIADPACVPAGK